MVSSLPLACLFEVRLDGAFCLPCVCFGMECGKNGSRLDKLFRSPLTFWTTAISRLQSHSCGKSETHNFSLVAMANFKDVMERRAVPIDQLLNRLVERQINDNRNFDTFAKLRIYPPSLCHYVRLSYNINN